MSPQQPNIETDDEHSLSTEPEEQAHLQDVVPEAADAGNEGAESRDVENAHKYALKNFIENLLPIIDSMEMGQTAAEADNATLESIREGSALTMNMFVQVLEKNGLEQIDPMGEKFDPEKHQAISMIEAEGAESNSVIEVMQKGFSLNERLVRPAMVVVAK
jgi:molecular chaperone GrpE